MSSSRPSRAMMRTGAVVLVAAAAGAGAVIGVDHATDSGSSPAPVTTAAAAEPTLPAASTTPGEPSLSTIYARENAGVVLITSTIKAANESQPGGIPGGGSGTETAQGSGVVLDTQGHILTNEHVVDGASSVKVKLADGTQETAKVLGEDKSSDLAVIDVSVPASKLDPIPLGSSSSLKVGDWVMAIGNPFGYVRSASVGIVSGLGRSIQAPNGFTIDNAIQTDAAINHGNSGGALLDAQGRLVGVPAQIADSGVDANVGVGFAVPVDTAKKIIGTLEKGEKVSHAWLGVSTATVDGGLAGQPGVGASTGALITGVVPDSPAAKAGLKAGTQAGQDDGQAVCLGGDVITAVDGTRVADADALGEVIGAKSADSTITLTVAHSDGSTAQVPVTLATRPASAPDPAPAC